MANINRKTFYQNRWPWWRYVLIGFILLALIISIKLSWHYLAGGTMAGCGGGSPCDHVLNSRWSVIAGILPVSGLAVGAYLSMLIASFYIDSGTELSIRRMAWYTMLVLVGAVAGSAIWFTILQKWIIGQYCIYCMTAHITGLLLAILVIWRAFKEHGNPSRNPTQHSIKGNKKLLNDSQRIFKSKYILRYVLIGLTFAGTTAAIQMNLTSSVHHEDGTKISIPALDYNDVPLTGPSDAPYIVTLLFDYQCAHCQKIHFMLNDVVRQYNGLLAFSLRPSPLEKNCNPYISSTNTAFKNSCELAKIGMAVWLANKKVFPTFENWMFTFDSGNRWKPRNPDDAITKAVELVGKESFNTALQDLWIQQYIQNSIRIFGQTSQNGKAGIPKMIYNDTWIIPEPYNADDLVMILHKSLGVPMP